MEARRKEGRKGINRKEELGRKRDATTEREGVSES